MERNRVDEYKQISLIFCICLLFFVYYILTINKRRINDKKEHFKDFRKRRYPLD